jgi:predicted N-acetyltransferase YhbS
MPLPVINRPLEIKDHAKLIALHKKAFGPGRFARTAYRVREGLEDITPLCHGAFLEGDLIAAVRMTPVTIGGSPGALLLGPLVVDSVYAGQGYGKALVREVIEDGRREGFKLVVLVGDEPYYGRFGFKPVPAGHIIFPGPVNPQRILAAELSDGAITAMRGMVAAAP